MSKTLMQKKLARHLPTKDGIGNIRPLMSGDFRLGTCTITPAADVVLRNNVTRVEELLVLHLNSQHGIVSTQEYKANRNAISEGGRILSVFPVGADTVWVSTDVEPLDSIYFNDNSTTICLFSEGQPLGWTPIDSKELSGPQTAAKKGAERVADNEQIAPTKEAHCAIIYLLHSVREPKVKSGRPIRFALGQCHLTVAAQEVLNAHQTSAELLLVAHQTGRLSGLALADFTETTDIATGDKESLSMFRFGLKNVRVRTYTFQSPGGAESETSILMSYEHDVPILGRVAARGRVVW